MSESEVSQKTQAGSYSMLMFSQSGTSVRPMMQSKASTHHRTAARLLNLDKRTFLKEPEFGNHVCSEQTFKFTGNITVEIILKYMHNALFYIFVPYQF